MQIESIRNTINVLSQISENIQTSIQPRIIQYDELSELNKSTIIDLYGKYGERMLELLLETPYFGLPIVIDRLEEKLAEWKYIRYVFDSEMREIYINNYKQSYNIQRQIVFESDKRNFGRKFVINIFDDLKFKDNEILSKDYVTLPVNYSPKFYSTATHLICNEIIKSSDNKVYHYYLENIL